MNNFAKEMAFYSAYHQETTNVWIHVLGVPLISFSAFVMLCWVPLFEVAGVNITLATAFFVASTLYYLRLDLAMGLIATVLYGGLLLAAHEVAAMGMTTSLAVFGAGQLIGWGAQIFGHLHFEQNRPAFYENLFQSLVSAPIFVIADVLFHLGFKTELQREVTQILADTGRLREFNKEEGAVAS